MPNIKDISKWIKFKDTYFKKKFIEKYRLLLDDRLEEFLEWSLKPLRKSIRINTIKVDKDNIKSILDRLETQGWVSEQIPWYKYGFWIVHNENKRDIGNTIEFQLGYIYSQEAASMIPPIVLDPKEGEFILDMAAAPGSKTTQIAMHMNNKGIIIANDIEIPRIKALAENIQRCGVTNTLITMKDGRDLNKLSFYFDKILLDAPCSGVGALRKSYKTIYMWNQNMVNRLSKLQKSLIETAFNLLKEGGILVYSTCTLEPEENEEVVSWLIEKYDNAKIEKIEIPYLKKSEPVLEWNNKKYVDDVKKCIRIYPQDNDTEGFFIAKIRKL